MIKGPEGVTQGERLKELSLYTLAKLKAEGMWKVYKHPQNINRGEVELFHMVPEGCNWKSQDGRKENNYLLEKASEQAQTPEVSESHLMFSKTKLTKTDTT